VSSIAIAGGVLAWGAAPTAATTGSIMAFGPRHVAVDESATNSGLVYVTNYGSGTVSVIAQDSVSMGEGEDLQILQGGRADTYVFRIWDEFAGEDGGLGRSLLLGVEGCTPLGELTAELECSLIAGPISGVRVDFTRSSGPTNVAIMDNAPIPLDFKGGPGTDYVQGGAGNDTLLGFGGDDFLYGGPGDDLLAGGPGDDYLEGETGRDDMRGGTGSNSIDAVDNTADIRVDCGGTPADLDFDDGKDVPVNCGENPTPVPPSPVEPEDPPAPGEGGGTVDGVPTTVNVQPEADDTQVVTITTGPSNPLFQSNLWWFGTPTTPPVPTFPPQFSFFEVNVSPLMPLSFFDVSIFPPSPFSPLGQARSALVRSSPVASESYTADANGVVRANVPIPGGMDPGDYTLQFNGITATGAQMTVNVGVRLDQATPEPEPQPEESITLTKAKRGKGKKVAVITVRGTTEGLAGTAVTPRYRVKGAKKWKTATPITLSAEGAFTWKVTTRKQVTIQVRSGAVKSNTLKVSAAKRR